MESNLKTIITEDLPRKQIKVTRMFAADPERVWNAWTDAELLDLWWAPKPWRAETKTMDFREGGFWLYAMVGPDGTRQYARVDFKSISPQVNFVATDSFCDEEGNVSDSFPRMDWNCTFSQNENGTKVDIVITFEDEASLEKIIEMGFKEGFTSGHDNLDELLSRTLAGTA